MYLSTCHLLDQRKRTEHDMHHHQPTAGFGFCYTDWYQKIEEISYKQLTSLCNEEICGTLHVPRKQTNKKTKSKVDYVNAMQQLDCRLKNLVCSWNFGYFGTWGCPPLSWTARWWSAFMTDAGCFLHAHLQHIWRTCDSAPGGHPPRCPWPWGCFHQ